MSTPSKLCPCGKWPLPMMSTAIMMPEGQKVPAAMMGAELVVTMICPVCGMQLQQRKSLAGDGILMTPGNAENLLQRMAEGLKRSPS